MNDKLLEFLNSKYPFPIMKVVRRVDGGYLSDNYVVGDGAAEYFLKAYRSKYIRQDIENVHKVKKFFRANGIPVILPLHTIDGCTFVDFEGSHYCLFPFVKAKTIKPEHASDKAVRSMARMQAYTHLLSRDSLPRLHERRVSLWSKSKSLKKGALFAKILREKEPDDFDRMAENFVDWKIEAIRNNKITPSKIGLKPNHLIHGDFHGYNLFFDDDDEVKYVFDLEKTVYAPRSYELVRAMDYICLNDFNFPKAGKYLRVYREVYPMSDNEFRKGFLFYLMKGIHTFWIEENHYLDHNTRTDVFYKGDTEKTKYYRDSFDEVVTMIIGYSRSS